MTDVNEQEREFGLAGHPASPPPGGGVAASGQVTMEVVPGGKKKPFDQDDEDVEPGVGDESA